MRLVNQTMIVLAAGLLFGEGVAEAQRSGPRASVGRVQSRAKPRATYIPLCTETRIDRCIQFDALDGSSARIPTCPGHPSCRRKARR